MVVYYVLLCYLVLCNKLIHSDVHIQILMETTKYNNWLAYTVQLVVKYAAGVRNMDAHAHPSRRYRVVRARGCTQSCIDTITVLGYRVQYHNIFNSV